MRKVFYLFISLLFLNSCIDRVELRDIKVLNKAGYNVYCLNSSTDNLITHYSGYEDYQIFDNCFKVEKDSFNNVYNKPSDWNSYIMHSEGGKMRLFIIAQDSVEKYGWKEVITKNIYTKIYKLDISDLNNKNWQIVFDGK